MKKKVKRKNNNITKKTTYKNKKKKRIKIKFGRIFLTLLILFFIFYLISILCKFPIKNIIIKGNAILSDQEVIDASGLSNYPSIFKYSTNEIEKKLEKNTYIKSAKIKKKKLKQVYIEIEENKALFYNKKDKKTVLLNKEEVKEEIQAPILINYVPDKIYKLLIEKMTYLDSDIINRISEIKYDPSNVDEERFLLTMTDGNYVYITLEKMEDLNNYVDISLEIINKFGKKDGILNLDAGEYFEIFED